MTTPKAIKALFTLSYLISFELNKLLNHPQVQKIVDLEHVMKFKSHFKKSLSILQADGNTINGGQQQSTNFSVCFLDLELFLNKTYPDDPYPTNT